MKSTLVTLATLLLTTTALAASTSFAALDRADIRVTWQGKRYTPATLPSEIGKEPLSAMEFWRPWAEEHEYQMAFNDDARVMLLLSRKRSPKKSLAQIEETAAVVGDVAPLAAPRPVVSERPERGDKDGKPGVELDPGVEPEDMTWTWEDTGPPLGTQTAVVLELYGRDEYFAVLDLLAEHHEYLAPWVSSAGERNGFSLEQPLCAAFLKDGPGSEEWDPENELVHRTAQLLFKREYGRQPNWLESGLAWYVEQEVRGTLYCFPYRNGFVGVTEHTGWDKELKRQYKKRDDVDMDALADFGRGTFDRDSALHAFGAGTFLAEHHSEDLPRILEELFTTIRTEGRVNHDDGTWELIPGYEPSAETQQAIIAKHLGPRWMDELHESFKKGRSYRP
jgi:hypothetical protein